MRVSLAPLPRPGAFSAGRGTAHSKWHARRKRLGPAFSIALPLLSLPGEARPPQSGIGEENGWVPAFSIAFPLPFLPGEARPRQRGIGEENGWGPAFSIALPLLSLPGEAWRT